MIPDWNLANVLPPIRPGVPGHSDDRSPYKVGLVRLIERFATSSERIKILEGLLAYRKELHNIGIISGFQWLNGSFMENVEFTQNRPPNDIDVVSFFHLPAGITQQALVKSHSHLFTPAQTKKQFYVDAYHSVLGTPMLNYHVRTISYWYSMWSHRRDQLWKGFIQIDISSGEEVAAYNLLQTIRQGGV